MNDDASPMGDDPTANFIRSNTIKIPAVLALDGINAVTAVAGVITDPVRIPVRIEYAQGGGTRQNASHDPMQEAQPAESTPPPPFGLSDNEAGAEQDAAMPSSGSMAPRRRRR